MTQSWGFFARRMWRTSLRLYIPNSSGGVLYSLEWDDAILDTGSPVHVIPGRAPSFDSPGEARLVERIGVELTESGNRKVNIELPHSGLFPMPIGGVEAKPRVRFEFWGRLQSRQIPMLGEAPFIIMDTTHPIISVGQCLEDGGQFLLEHGRFQVR
ncbi:MAG: hypothetical protein KF886_08550 [Candidatus Hydrogenedentes bacterium]|nr:hypothetical protein [Candidatus Hydrogenedentota bacterium]